MPVATVVLLQLLPEFERSRFPTSNFVFLDAYPFQPMISYSPPELTAPCARLDLLASSFARSSACASKLRRKAVYLQLSHDDTDML